MESKFDVVMGKIEDAKISDDGRSITLTFEREVQTEDDGHFYIQDAMRRKVNGHGWSDDGLLMEAAYDLDRLERMLYDILVGNPRQKAEARLEAFKYLIESDFLDGDTLQEGKRRVNRDD